MAAVKDELKSLGTPPSPPQWKKRVESKKEPNEHIEGAAKAPGGGIFAWAPGENERTTLHPILNPEIWKFRKIIEGLHWAVEEVDLSSCKADWIKFTDAERHTIKYALGLFAVFDNLVLKNLPRLSDAVDCLEAQAFYAGQGDQESTHMEAYMLQIEALARDEEERQFMLNSIKNMPGVALLVKWAKHWMNESLPYAERFIAFAAIEGVIFHAFFAILQILREHNLMHGVTELNEFITRDEGLHSLFACHLVKEHMRAKPSASRVRAIFNSAMKTTAAMVEEAMPGGFKGVSADEINQYVCYQADFVAGKMGYPPIYGVKNELKFMDKVAANLTKKVNFFERRGNAYQAATAGSSVWIVNRTPIPE